MYLGFCLTKRYVSTFVNRHILYRLDIFFLHSFIVTDVEMSAFSECFLFVLNPFISDFSYLFFAKIDIA